MATATGELRRAHFSTESLRPVDRLPYYREVIVRTVAKCEIEPLDERFRFDASMLPGLGVARIAASPVRVTLTRQMAATCAELAKGRGVRAARLSAVKSDIMAHLTHPDLSVGAVAVRQGISEPYIRTLFQGEGTSFSDFVLSQRLARAHRMLTDPRFADRSVTSIAYDAGFGDLSYFDRCFRRRFGDTPSAIRANAANGAGK